MELESLNTTFNEDELLDITINLFIASLNDVLIKDEVTAFEFYDASICVFIENLQNKVEYDSERLDFYESISIMSWALYREWVKKVINENCDLNCFALISRKKIIELFMENLMNCNNFNNFASARILEKIEAQKNCSKIDV